MTGALRRHWWFWAGFAGAILLIAGVASDFASSSPDGLDSATLRGCQVIQTAQGEELTGNCIAQHATEHHDVTCDDEHDSCAFRDSRAGGLAGFHRQDFGRGHADLSLCPARRYRRDGASVRFHGFLSIRREPCSIQPRPVLRKPAPSHRAATSPRWSVAAPCE